MHNKQVEFEKRKQDHIQLALMPANQAAECNTLDSISLIHEALPDLDFSEITLQTTRLGHVVSTPFMVSSMTAGHEQAEMINAHLLAACAESGWAMGVGSQRRELFDTEAAFAWQPLRAQFPKVSLFSNLGITQLIETPLSRVQKLIDSIEAEALIIHCNPLQEVIQHEGTPYFKGCWEALELTVKNISTPLIIKETGCGFSKTTLARLNNIGIAAVDISGLGGTHWGRIEGNRAAITDVRKKTAETFKNWGIPTVQSLRYAAAVTPDFEIWGSGGVRHGLDAAKLLALGATTIGLAQPLLESALQNGEAVYNFMMGIHYELQVAMFCTGSRTIGELKEKICL